MRRRRVFRALRWAGRLAGLTVVAVFAWLLWCWAAPHLWLQFLLAGWSAPFIPVGWIGGSVLAQQIAIPLLKSRVLRR